MSGYIKNDSSFWIAVLGVSLLKLLLINSYRSTDFEVHRNWLAITHTLPLDKWYYEKTSEWTLDYPPFFAYFEWILSQGAKYFDPQMLKVTSLNYASFNTILFQKLSVILVDFLLGYSLLRCSKILPVLYSKTRIPPTLEALFVLVFLNGGLFMVDQIHFQYNGFLFGIFLLSIVKCLEEKYYHAACIFAVLLNFKHIFLYVAPAFGVYLLRRKCFPSGSEIQVGRVLTSICSFGLIGVSVLAAAFGPFYKHIPQIVSRLFPFQRGLSHAYWAPNIWAPYNTLDWTCNIVLQSGKSSVTSGLVGERPLSFLPQILPIHTFILTLGLMMPTLITLWKHPTERKFVHGIILTGWTSFMFGYHVHEKAILNVLIPFSLISFQEPRLYLVTLAAGTVSLFPLLFTPFEIVLKGLIFVLNFSLTLHVLPKVKFHWVESLYICGLFLVYMCENLGPIFLPRLPFLPLMIVSDYTFLGIFYGYIMLYWRFIFGEEALSKKVHVRNLSTEMGSKPKKSKVASSPPATPTRVLRKRNK